MTTKKIICTDEISEQPGDSENLAFRSSVYAILAKGFSFPDEKIIEFFNQCSEAEISEPGDVFPLLEKVIQTANSMSKEELQEAHISIFDPLAGPFPYESENKELHDFSKAHLMADIMGFYKAFGVEPVNERADHIVSELEFMHFLTLKEGHAYSTDSSENAVICRDAQKKFFTDHLITWTGALSKAIKTKGGNNTDRFYLHLLDLLNKFIEYERQEFS